MRILLHEAKRFLDEFNKRHGTNLTLQCSRPGTQTQCLLAVVSNETGGIIPLVERTFTPSEVYFMLNAIERIGNLKRKGILKGDIC